MMYKLCFYVPLPDADRVKAALFAEGAGRIGNYSHCCFETKGQGQFMPLNEATPAIGNLHELETVQEMKIELVCPKSCIKPVLQALLSAHPYECPAYQVWPVLSLKDLAD